MDRVARHAWIRGTVQGVAFRWHTKQRARELGLAGWIQNLPDGSVEAWIEGDGPAVETMVAWLQRGPPAARVAGVDVVEAQATGAERFEVR
ncbi:MAG: acylphosphatase [Planctomycetota bacterium]